MNHTELTEPDRTLLQSAINAADRLYVPGIQEVGAAVGTADRQIFTGIHFETATGFANICGEVAAICCMVAAGHRDLDTVAAVWRDPDGKHYLLPPCGRCREVISDFNPQAWVIISTLPDHWDAAAIDHPVKVRVADLLPRRSHQLRAPAL
jgi:cytidine deaminase